MNTIVRRLFRLASVLAAAVFSCSSFAYYVVNQIDYTDPVTHAVANYTGLWGNTNNGMVIGNASFDGGISQFSFIYDPATGNFSPLPQPPGFDGITSVASALSINDAGVITGGTFEPAGNRGFILNSGAFSFFSNPTWLNTSGRTMSNPTAAHPQGLVVGFSDNGDILSAIGSSTGFVYDPVTSAFAPINPPNSYFTIAQAYNLGGQIVGSLIYRFGSGLPNANGRWGFLFTPTTGADPMLGGTFNVFRINDMQTWARGINDNGVLAAAVLQVPGGTRSYVGTSSGFELIDVPNSTGPACPDGTFPGTFPEGLNNAGQVTGILTDNACNVHGFIATPAALPTGTTSGGAYTFSVDVVPNVPIFIDPAVASGYDYEIGKHDPRFASVRLPLGIGNNKFVLVVGHKAYDLNAGQLFDFRARGFKKGVKAFRVACIDPAAALDPANPLAFPTELTFVAAGRFTGTQTPLTDSAGKDNGNDHSQSSGHHDDEPMSQAECRQRLLSAHDAGGPDD